MILVVLDIEIELNRDINKVRYYILQTVENVISKKPPKSPAV